MPPFMVVDSKTHGRLEKVVEDLLLQPKATATRGRVTTTAIIIVAEMLRLLHVDTCDLVLPTEVELQAQPAGELIPVCPNCGKTIGEETDRA